MTEVLLTNKESQHKAYKWAKDGGTGGQSDFIVQYVYSNFEHKTRIQWLWSFDLEQDALLFTLKFGD